MDNLRHPNTRTVLLEGLRQALQARVAQIYNTVTLAGEPEPAERAKKGLERAIKSYENAWHYICEISKEEEK